MRISDWSSDVCSSDLEGNYVLEMSSYQLELTPTLHFRIAALLNVSADHPDRHGGMHAYVAVKMRIFAHQGQADVAVVGADDPYARHLPAALRAGGRPRVVPVSADRPRPGRGWVATGPVAA